MPISENQAYKEMNTIMGGKLSNKRIENWLLDTNERYEKEPISYQELNGYIRAIKEKSIRIHYASKTLIDTCGTGGSGLNAINASTPSAIMASAYGIPTAKHGNRSFSSKSGSADLLEEFGGVIFPEKDHNRRMLREIKFAFLYAPHMHLAMKRVKKPRKKLKQKTVFNILGPLCHPLELTGQVIGVSDQRLCEPFIKVLKNQGLENAMVVYGDGLDEITLSGDTEVYHLENEKISNYTINPEKFGYEKVELSEIQGGGAKQNAQEIKEIFSMGPIREELIPKRNFILLNSAAAISVGTGKSLEESLKEAERTLTFGKAKNQLNRIIGLSRIISRPSSQITPLG